MTAEQFRWLEVRQPRPETWTAVERAIWDAYEAEYSLRVYPDGTEVEPPPDLRTRVLDITSRLPVLPPDDTISCLGCNDTGFSESAWSYIAAPCMECGRGDWTWGHELNDDMRGDR